MNARTPRLLIFLQWFTPAHKAGGPITSIQNLVDLISDKFDIYIYSGDRDMFDLQPFENTTFDTWVNRDNKFHIMYTRREHHSGRSIKRVVTDLQPDTIYLNSMYSYTYFLLPLMVLRNMKFSGTIVLAPRGMLKSSAIRFKPLKKKIFLLILSISHLLNKVKVQATDIQEYTDVIHWLRMDKADVTILNNPLMAVQPIDPMMKDVGSLRLVFNGRIHPIKGLDIVLDAVRHIQGRIHVDVVGFIEIKTFYYACLEKIKRLPPNISVDIHGDQPFKICMDLLSKAHCLILPTHGENFGHAIFESFCHGKPAIISSETPWKNLTQKGIGWDIDLAEPQKFAATIQYAVDMGNEEYRQMSITASQFATTYITESCSRERYTDLFLPQK